MTMSIFNARHSAIVTLKLLTSNISYLGHLKKPKYFNLDPNGMMPELPGLRSPIADIHGNLFMVMYTHSFLDAIQELTVLRAHTIKK